MAGLLGNNNGNRVLQSFGGFGGSFGGGSLSGGSSTNLGNLGSSGSSINNAISNMDTK